MLSHSIDICRVAIKKIGNMHAVSANQIADILHFNDKRCYGSNTKYVIWLIERACIFLILLIATVHILMACETQESEAGYAKHWNL